MKSLVRLATIAAAIVSLGLGACSHSTAAGAVFDAVTMSANSQVPADAVTVMGNTFDILEIGAYTFARYCVDNKQTPAPCSVNNRRLIVKAVKSGRAARNAAEAAVNNGQPVGVGVYNALRDAVGALQNSPVQQFTTQR